MNDKLTAFERRKRKIRVHSREKVNFGEESCPELRDWLRRMQDNLISEVVTDDPAAADFLEWFADEYKKYGSEIRPGMAVLYWHWSHLDETGRRVLDDATYVAQRESLMANWQGVELDGEFCSPATLVQEFIWWTASDWLLQRHLVEAMNEFQEYHNRGKMPDWRRKKRRRLAAQRRKEIKQLHELAPAGWSGEPPAGAAA